MKKIKYLLGVLITGIILNACEPEAISPIGESRNVLSSLKGTWSLSSFIQVDEFAKSSNFPFKTVDYTNVYPYKEAKITFNVDDQNKPTTFAINYGNSPKFIKVTTGNWKVDNTDAPKTIVFSNTTTVKDSVIIGKYQSLDNNELQLTVRRYQVDSKGNQKLVISNNYYFKKSN